MAAAEDRRQAEGELLALLREREIFEREWQARMLAVKRRLVESGVALGKVDAE